jgi:hypothetical protein
VNVIALLIPDSKAAELVDPRMSSLDNPAKCTQAAAMGSAPLCQNRLNPAASQLLAVGFGVVGSIPLNAIGFPSGRSGLPPDRGNVVYQGQQLCQVMRIGSGDREGHGNASRIREQMMLRARFPSVSGIGAGLRPPKTARTEELSTMARDQSILSASRSLESSTSWILCHTPARCHSWRCDQQVIPQPQPSSWGRYSQGMPVLNTNTMPVSTLRWSRGRRPGHRVRRGLGGGSKGLISFHNESSNSGFAMCKLLPWINLHMTYQHFSHKT